MGGDGVEGFVRAQSFLRLRVFRAQGIGSLASLYGLDLRVQYLVLLLGSAYPKP